METSDIPNNWDLLHDASLQDLLVHWEKQIVIIKIVSTVFTFPEIGNASIVAENVYSITCPIQSPWGKSSSINEVKQIGERLEIEMQSGDTIIIEASTFKLVET